jgi:hypothetical protein
MATTKITFEHLADLLGIPAAFGYGINNITINEAGHILELDINTPSTNFAKDEPVNLYHQNTASLVAVKKVNI